jgi:integrase
MSWVKKRGAKWYIGYTNAAGKRLLRATEARTKAEAERLAAEHSLREHRIREGLQDAPPPPMEWGAFCDAFEREEVPKRRSPGTMRSRLKRVRAAFSGRQLQSIRFADLSAFISGLRDVKTARGRVMEPQGIEHHRRLLRVMFNAAIKRNWYRGPNPASEVDAIAIPEKTPTFIDLPDIVKLLAVVPLAWRPLVACAISLGLRKGELLGLRRRNVHLHRLVLIVTHSYDGPTKTGKPRTVAIPEELVPYLVTQLQVAGGGEYLFPPLPGVRLPKGAKRMTKDTDLAERLATWLKQAGVSVPANWKDLRSTFGTLAAEQTDLRFVQQSLGHTDPNLTAKRYSALRESNLVRQGRGLRLLSADKTLTTATLEVEGAAPAGGESPVKTAPSEVRDTGFEPVAFGFGGHGRSTENPRTPSQALATADQLLLESARRVAADRKDSPRRADRLLTSDDLLVSVRRARAHGFTVLPPRGGR